MIDAHTHIGVAGAPNIAGTSSTEDREGFIELFKSGRLSALVNATSEIEFSVFNKIPYAYVSFGMHPWHSDQFLGKSIKEELMYNLNVFKKADAIGEIGLDNVWCSCDENTQLELFRVQMDIAQNLKKPVVLHVKGCEEKMLCEIKKYDVKKLIHWYSCEDFLEEYIEQDCYFSVGIDILKNNTVSKRVSKTVPIDRLLVETDGLEAIRWATGRKVSALEIPDILEESLSVVADNRSIKKEALSKKIAENFLEFLKD